MVDCLSTNIETRVKEIKKIHEQVGTKIKKSMQISIVNKSLSTFKEGDLIKVHLRKGRFPPKSFGNLANRVDGLFEVLKDQR